MENPIPKPETLLTRTEVAAWLGCSIRHLDDLREQGEITYISMGYKTLRFRRQDVEDYILRHLVPDRNQTVTILIKSKPRDAPANR